VTTSNQVKAWAPDDIHFSGQKFVQNGLPTLLKEGVVVGFGELEPDGHIDCFYCHKNYQRRGVGNQIYQAIEAKCLS